MCIYIYKHILLWLIPCHSPIPYTFLHQYNGPFEHRNALAPFSSSLPAARSCRSRLRRPVQRPPEALCLAAKDF